MSARDTELEAFLVHVQQTSFINNYTEARAFYIAILAKLREDPTMTTAPRDAIRLVERFPTLFASPIYSLPID